MAGVNMAVLLGHVGKDPEIRAMPNGDKVANFSLATSEAWKDKNTQERVERTEWHRITVWGPLADIVERYVRKGSKVHLIGKIQTRKYTDNAGVEKYTTEIVLQKMGGNLTLLNKKPDGNVDESGESPSQGSAPRAGGPRGPIDDDIPFAPCVL